MIYFDNSAASYPKPEGIFKNVKYIYENYSFNVGRGGYKQSLRTAEKVYETRELAAKIFNADTEKVVFTKNCTEALNYAIKGLAKKGDSFIISPFEHNSVTRVLKRLCDDGIADYEVVEFSYDDDEFVENFKKLIKSNTKAIICTLSSNVFGCVMPIKRLGKLCKEKGIRFIVDASQGAGILDIDVKEYNIDILCTSGQKSLYGVMGTGLMIINGNIHLNTIIEGGTGSRSLDLMQPEFLPDRFESGTLNVPGIIFLGEGIKFINKVGMNNIYNRELSLISYLYDSLSEINGVKLYTPNPEKNRFTPIISFNYKDYSSEKTAYLLASKDICTRGGYHCSPLAHKTFGTLDRGTVRISVGAFNNLGECNKFINILKNM